MKKIKVNCVVCLGQFLGGEIEPGTFHGGEIEPGTFHNDEIKPSPNMNQKKDDKNGNNEVSEGGPDTEGKAKTESSSAKNESDD